MHETNIFEEQINSTLNKLKELENIKDNLTKREYNKRKKEIYKIDKKETKQLFKKDKNKC